MPAKGTRKGYRTCMACKSKEPSSDRKFLCAKCAAERGICVSCGGDMPKYSRKNGGPRLTCGQTCHNRRILKIPAVRSKLNESRKKTSTAMWQSEEFRIKHHAAMEGVWSSPEWLEKHSDAMKKRWENPAFRNMMVNLLTELWGTPEYKEIARLASLRGWNDPGAREKIIEASRTNSRTPEARRVMSERAKRTWSNPEYVVRKRESSRRMWRDSNYRNTVIGKVSISRRLPNSRAATSVQTRLMWASGRFDKRARGRAWGMTGIERLMINALCSFGIVEFAYNFQLGRFRLDIAFPELKLDIECDGKFWHSLPGVLEKDARRDEFAALHGWTVVRLSEDEINESASRVVEDKIIPTLLALCGE